MLCQHCHTNESTLRFFIDFGGEGNVVEVNLCADCAEKLGKQAIAWHRYLAGRMPTGVPAGATSAQHNISSMPFHRQVQRTNQEPVPDDAGEDIRRRRSINELRVKLQQAVLEEKFEQAATLRDEIKKLEKTQA